jgi:predicted small metal-binding protein
MELKCDDVVPGLGCDFVAKGSTAEEVHGAMMMHGGTVHANLMDGKSPQEMMQAKTEMDAHISELIAANN